MKRSRLFCCGLLTLGAALLTPGPSLHAAPVIRAGTGISGAEIQVFLDLFTVDLGGGHSTVSWDTVPDELASPNSLPGDYFASVESLGIHLSTPGTGLLVSADAENPTGALAGFADIDPSYAGLFQAFSAERFLAAIGSTEVTVSFSSSSQPAAVTGFGAVFSGVDSLDSTYIEFFDSDNNSLTTVFVPPAPQGGLSFLGVSFDGGELVGSVTINSGTAPLANGTIEIGGVDLVVLDDLVFSTPVPEPSTYALFGLGALALLAISRLRK